jgi:PAS domain S-box-containing protein
LGRPRAQFLGQVPWQLVFFKDVAPTEASFHELSQQGHLHVDHLPLTTAQGRPLAVELVANSYAVEGDPVIQWHLRDITQRKQAEAALRESETRFRNLFQNNGSVMLLLDPETGEILDANQMAEAYYGYPLSALIGMPISRINLRPAQEVAVERELARREARNYFNFQHRLADGQIRDVEVYSTPVATGGKELLISIVHDITARKQTEQQLKLQSSALVAAANAIIITDRDAKIEWVNPAFSQLTGYAANEAIGQHMRLLKSGQHPPAFYSQMWATILSGQVWHGELVNKRKDGGLCTEDTTITPVRGADGQIAHFVAVKQNVTERRQMEQRIQQAEKMEAIGRLAGGIAHDFNNILAAMMGFSHLLQQDTQGNALAQESIAEILKATDRARELVGQILTFSRQREQSQRIIQLETVVKEAAKLLRASLPAQIKIELDLSSETPTVLADPTQIYQVTMNLATNALHAMEDCPGRLTLRLEAFQPSAEFIRSHPRLQPALYARLTVTDTGPGMDAKTLQRIFEPFFTTKPVGKGTGLGLAVVHGIVESHGGLITVESAVGHGTKFCLYFPARTGEYTLSEPAPVQPRTGQGQKILLVDDEPALTSAFQKMLQRLNYSVTPLNSAREALALFQLNPGNFDVLITDLTMPEMNGLELARRIHACRPQLPVILASGYSPELQRETSQVADICELLEKPVSLTSLASALQRALTKAST